MKKLLNTLYVTTANAYLQKDGENLVVTVEKEEVFRIPIHVIEGVILFTYMGISPGALSLCTSRGVKVSFHAPSGRFLATVSGPVKGNVLLRRQQYRIADDAQHSVSFAASFILGKIVNQGKVLSRYLRDNRPTDTVRNAIQLTLERIKAAKNTLFQRTSTDLIRGDEGMIAQLYFSHFRHLILNPSFTFSARSKRPPLDEVNCLLSYGYTLLAHDVSSALEAVGLDPYVGFRALLCM